MIELPKVKKGVGTGLTKLEKVKNAILATVVATGLALGGGLASNANAATATTDTRKETSITTALGALVLSPALVSEGAQLIAQHWSHSSHYSHSSHHSHYSHYSSRY